MITTCKGFEQLSEFMREFLDDSHNIRSGATANTVTSHGTGASFAYDISGTKKLVLEKALQYLRDQDVDNVLTRTYIKMELLNPFLEDIKKNGEKPTRAHLQFNIDNAAAGEETDTANAALVNWKKLYKTEGKLNIMDFVHRRVEAEAGLLLTNQTLKLAEREIGDFKSAGTGAFADFDEVHPQQKDEHGKVIREEVTVTIPAAAQFAAELKKLRVICDAAQTKFIAALHVCMSCAKLVACTELWNQSELQFANQLQKLLKNKKYLVPLGSGVVFKQIRQTYADLIEEEDYEIDPKFSPSTGLGQAEGTSASFRSGSTLQRAIEDTIYKTRNKAVSLEPLMKDYLEIDINYWEDKNALSLDDKRIEVYVQTVENLRKTIREYYVSIYKDASMRVACTWTLGPFGTDEENRRYAIIKVLNLIQKAESNRYYGSTSSSESLRLYLVEVQRQMRETSYAVDFEKALTEIQSRISDLQRTYQQLGDQNATADDDHFPANIRRHFCATAHGRGSGRTRETCPGCDNCTGTKSQQFLCYKGNEGHKCHGCGNDPKSSTYGKQGHCVRGKCHADDYNLPGNVAARKERAQNVQGGGYGSARHNPDIICFRCNKKGHIARSCPNANAGGDTAPKPAANHSSKEAAFQTYCRDYGTETFDVQGRRLVAYDPLCVQCSTTDQLAFVGCDEHNADFDTWSKMHASLAPLSDSHPLKAHVAAACTLSARMSSMSLLKYKAPTKDFDHRALSTYATRALEEARDKKELSNQQRDFERRQWATFCDRQQRAFAARSAFAARPTHRLEDDPSRTDAGGNGNAGGGGDPDDRPSRPAPRGRDDYGYGTGNYGMYGAGGGQGRFFGGDGYGAAAASPPPRRHVSHDVFGNYTSAAFSSGGDASGGSPAKRANDSGARRRDETAQKNDDEFQQAIRDSRATFAALERKQILRIQQDNARERAEMEQAMFASFSTKGEYDQVDFFRTDRQREQAFAQQQAISRSRGQQRASARPSPTEGGGGGNDEEVDPIAELIRQHKMPTDNDTLGAYGNALERQEIVRRLIAHTNYLTRSLRSATDEDFPVTMASAANHCKLLDSKVENMRVQIGLRCNQMSEILKRESEGNKAWSALLKEKCDQLKTRLTDLDTVAAEFKGVFLPLVKDT